MQTGETQSSPINENHFHRYLQYAASIITSYKGNEPFNIYLKKYFSSKQKTWLKRPEINIFIVL